MLNITKSGNSVLIESSDNSQFPWVNGSLSVPQNTITYVLEENNDYIVFRDINTNDVLWTAFIHEMTIDGTQATRDNIIELFDSIANSSASSGVNSLNGFQGDVNIKSINGESLIGSGDITFESAEVDLSNYYTKDELKKNLTSTYNSYDGYDQIITNDGGALNVAHINGQSILGQKQSITIEGGSSSTVGVSSINIGSTLDENFQNTGDVNFYTSMYDGSYDCNINGTSFFGLKPADDTITITEGGGTANGCFRGSIKVNTDAIASGITVTETDPIFTEWKNNTNIFGGESVNVSGGSYNSAFGYNINFSDYNGNVIIGQEPITQGHRNIVLGQGATGGTENDNIAIGTVANASGGKRVAIGYYAQTDGTYHTNFNNVLKADENKYAFILNEYGNYVRIPTEWTGTQSEYDALGTYYDNITYNIIEG